MKGENSRGSRPESIVRTWGGGGYLIKRTGVSRRTLGGGTRAWTLKCPTGICDTEGAGGPSSALCATTGSHLSFPSAVPEMTPFGRWGPVSQVPEECGFYLTTRSPTVQLELTSGYMDCFGVRGLEFPLGLTACS